MTRSQVWFQAYLAVYASSNLAGSAARGADVAACWADKAVEEYGKRYRFAPAGDAGHTMTMPDLG